MSSIKCSLTIELPGATLVKVGKTKGSADYKSYLKPANQVINITEEAYWDFTRKANKPYKFQGNWAGMTSKQRVEWHLNKIAEALGGKIVSYHVYED